MTAELEKGGWVNAKGVWESRVTSLAVNGCRDPLPASTIELARPVLRAYTRTQRTLDIQRNIHSEPTHTVLPLSLTHPSKDKE
jgi:hypothetical protein